MIVSDFGDEASSIDRCNNGDYHDWVNRRWLSESRVWIQTCLGCKAIRFWRGNNTVHIERRQVYVVLQKCFAYENWPEKKVIRSWYQYPEFKNAAWIRAVLQEAEMLPRIRKELVNW